MSFEEWWNTKDYPARCKGNCKEAYEAGLHADVHTDNSAVIAELENKMADIKANCDLAIEGRDVKIMELEKNYKVLQTSYNILKDNDEKIIKEMGAQIEKMKCCGNCEHDYDEEQYITTDYCNDCFDFNKWEANFGVSN